MGIYREKRMWYSPKHLRCKTLIDTASMGDLIEHFKASAGRHFVTLSCVQTLPNGTEIAHVFSGFIAEVSGAWVFVTAGHVLRRFDEATAAGSTFSVWRLGDQTAAMGRFQDTAVPFEFSKDEWLVIEREDVGLDYAVIGLHDHFRRQLEAGGVTALDKTAWAQPTQSGDTQWALMGVPSESVRYDGKTILTARFVVVRVFPTNPPEGVGERSANQIYARLMDGSEAVVSNADGLSGGPIFAVTKADGDWKYSVIGVQSAWYRGQRLIAFCPWITFARELEKEVELARHPIDDVRSNAGASADEAAAD